jgi:hypothetical protein
VVGQMLRSLKFLSVACVLTLTLGQTKAKTFDVSGSDTLTGLGPDRTTPFGGWIIVTNGQITDASISSILGTYVMPGPFNTGPYTGTLIELTFPVAHVFGCANPTGPSCYDQMVLQFSVDVAGLVANQGGLIVSGGADCIDCGPAVGFANMTGTIVAATPLPPALPHFATGLGAMGLFGWRRKRKQAEAITAA